ncbi:thiol-disulfide isomerase/thioredoxin [Lutibacter oceani]|uniref:Thiol-disulfide isomerase/thioredoxin n=1 Tax=Lutibacter oceani TaxID=1853311 RepID=A0A3D9RPJ0_9FLAO|nr:TlpA disulfide reductase family protein [Lutibacter oceani]REE81717.1 thiol-disulfide isomerase/thioredoxin [Lutibacter oceani]
MNLKLNRKSISNIVFVIAVVVLLYPPSREWFMRQIAFAPSIENLENSEKINSYNWQLRGLNTENINFNELENKVVFVNFWATWCPPCRAEMPMIQELYNDYKDKIEFVFVTSESWETVEKFYVKNNYNLPSYNSISLPPEKFTETNSIPASYLIDKKGNILISKTGSANWNSDKVRDLLDELILK